MTSWNKWHDCSSHRPTALASASVRSALARCLCLFHRSSVYCIWFPCSFLDFSLLYFLPFTSVYIFSFISFGYSLCFHFLSSHFLFSVPFLICFVFIFLLFPLSLYLSLICISFYNFYRSIFRFSHLVLFLFVYLSPFTSFVFICTYVFISLSSVLSRTFFISLFPFSLYFYFPLCRLRVLFILHRFAFIFTHSFLFVLSSALYFIQYACNITPVPQLDYNSKSSEAASLGQSTHQRAWTCNISKRPHDETILSALLPPPRRITKWKSVCFCAPPTGVTASFVQCCNVGVL